MTTIILNTAILPGFVAANRDGEWVSALLATGRGGTFPGVALEHLLGPVETWGSPLRIVVVTGPGSSTSLRVVTSYANGLALATGAELASLSSFDLARLILPGTPDVLAFPQPFDRLVVARRTVDGVWSAADETVIPEGAVVLDGEPLEMLRSPKIFDALDAAATKVRVLTPTYWAPPHLTTSKTR